MSRPHPQRPRRPEGRYAEDTVWGQESLPAMAGVGVGIRPDRLQLVGAARDGTETRRQERRRRRRVSAGKQAGLPLKRHPTWTSGGSSSAERHGSRRCKDSPTEARVRAGVARRSGRGSGRRRTTGALRLEPNPC